MLAGNPHSFPPSRNPVENIRQQLIHMRARMRRKLERCLHLQGHEERWPSWDPANADFEVPVTIADPECAVALSCPEDTARALSFFRVNGYVVIKNAIPVGDCTAVVNAILAFLGMDRNDPDTWYRPVLPTTGAVEIYQHEAQWKIRESPVIHAICSAILGTDNLWTSMDRTNFKVPLNPAHPGYARSAFIHWDMDSSRISAQQFLQGLVVLEDTDVIMGGFQCVPGLFGDNLKRWIAEQPPNRNPCYPDLTRIPKHMQVTLVPAQAGDYIVWDSTLAHGNGRNLSDRPRFAQYVCQKLIPTGAEYDRQLRERVTAYNNLTCAPNPHHFADPRCWEKTNYGPPQLSLHGRQLLGSAVR